MTVTFRHAHRDEYLRIARFLDDYWEKDHIYVRAPRLFEWTFARPGKWDEESYSMVLAEDGSELVGILGGIPFTFNKFGESSEGVWIVNYVIRPDHRRGAAALQLLGRFRRPPFETVIASGINPATANIYRVLRGQVLPEIPRHFVVLPRAAQRFASLLRSNYPDWSSERAKALAQAFSLPELPQSTIDWEPHLPDDWDQNGWQAIATRTIGAARDADYLSWRYRRHPSFEYRFISVREGNAIGLAVWRLETIRCQTPEGRRADVDRIGRLVEFLPASPENAHHLITIFLQELATNDVLGADYYGYHGCSRTWLQRDGFASTEIHPDGPALPSRFQPLDGHGGGIWAAFFVPAGTPTCSAALDCAWCWTKADSDQDRPN